VAAMEPAPDSPPTDPHETIARLEERIRLLEAVIDNFPGGLLLFDKNLRLVLCNRQQRELLEYPDELFANGDPLIEEIFRFNANRGEYGPGDPERIVRMRMDLVRQRCVHVFERTRPNGVVIEVRGVPLSEGGFVTTYLDVTEQRRNQALIQHLAYHDMLTDLPNRALFLERLNQALTRVQRGEIVAVHYVDLDGFKPVNDALGHEAGDQLLKDVAQRLCRTIRQTDTTARYGGDEFLVLQVGLEVASDAAILARRMVAALEAPFTIRDRSVKISASIGIAVAPRDGDMAEVLLRNADKALYASKSSGGNRYQFYRANPVGGANRIDPLAVLRAD
jgi:diguanylate cyclase (GGDEF)-like protein